MAVRPVAASKKTPFGDEVLPKTSDQYSNLLASISPVDTKITSNAESAP